MFTFFPSPSALCRNSLSGFRKGRETVWLNANLFHVVGTGDLQGCACELHQGGVEAPGRRAAGHVQRCDAGEL